MSKQILGRMGSGAAAAYLVLAFMFGLTACAGGAAMPPPSAKTPPAQPQQSAASPTAMATATATATPAFRTARAVGNLVAPSQAALAFQTTGVLKELKVKEGDHVKAGDALANLDTAQLDLQVVQAQTAANLQAINLTKVKAGPTVDEVAIAKANLDKAKASLVRAQADYDKVSWRSDVATSQQAMTLQQAASDYQAAAATLDQTIHHPTQSELDTAQTQYDQAQAALAIAKQNVANATLRAPFDGTILSVKPKPGELVSQGTTAITIAELSHMQAEASLDEDTLARVRVGQPVSLTLEAFPDDVLTGRVSKVGLIGSTDNGVVSVPVTVDIDPTDVPIYPGLSANLEFTTSR